MKIKFHSIGADWNTAFAELTFSCGRDNFSQLRHYNKCILKRGRDVELPIFLEEVVLVVEKPLSC